LIHRYINIKMALIVIHTSSSIPRENLKLAGREALILSQAMNKLDALHPMERDLGELPPKQADPLRLLPRDHAPNLSEPTLLLTFMPASISQPAHSLAGLVFSSLAPVVFGLEAGGGGAAEGQELEELGFGFLGLDCPSAEGLAF
jgi:hypothetical protein